MPAWPAFRRSAPTLISAARLMHSLLLGQVLKAGDEENEPGVSNRSALASDGITALVFGLRSLFIMKPHLFSIAKRSRKAGFSGAWRGSGRLGGVP